MNEELRADQRPRPPVIGASEPAPSVPEALGVFQVNLGDLTTRWWALVLRGIVAVIFGLLAIVAPRISLLSLVMVFGAYAVVDGGLGIVAAAKGRRRSRRWGWMVVEGAVGIVAGTVALMWPGLTVLAALVIIAVWALLTGGAEIAAAILLRRVLRGEWLLALAGLLSIALGVLLIAFPYAASVALAWMIGTYALVFGAIMVWLGIRIRRWDTSFPSRRPDGSGFPSGDELPASAR